MIPGGWVQWMLVMAGGALGAAARFWLGGALLRRLGEGIPWGTLASNLIGAFAVGLIAEWLHGRGGAAAHWRAFLIVGVLGALTTYSSLVLELLLMQRTGRSSVAIGYLLATLALGLALAWLGARVGLALRAS